MRALCVGKCHYCNLVLASYPIEGSKNIYEEIVEGGIGAGFTNAYLLGKFGIDTYVGAATGDDTYGSSIRKSLEAINVHTEYMEIAYEKKTPFNIQLINKENKLATSFSFIKENLLLKKTEFQMDPDLVIVDGSDYGACLAALNKYSQKITIMSASVYSKEIVELCKYCKYLIFTKEFAENITGQKADFENPQSLVTMYSMLLNKFPNRQLIVTLKEKGALYMINNQIKVMPGLNATVVDETADQDIFNGAFAYALLQNYDLERTITFANIARSISVTKLGVKEAIPAISDIMTYFNQKYGTVNAQNSTPAQQA